MYSKKMKHSFEHILDAVFYCCVKKMLNGRMVAPLGERMLTGWVILREGLSDCLSPKWNARGTASSESPARRRACVSAGHGQIILAQRCSVL
jgi:hypothetical protein